jgi:hypothetical protein
MLGRMKTILAAIVSIAFLAPAAMACPHDGAETKTVKKDEKASPPKQADAKPAPAPKATPKPAPAAAPKAPAKTPSEQGKVSAK